MLSHHDLDRIVFGCGNFGGIGSSPKLRNAGDSEDQALRLLDHARRLGLRRFDTANTYGGGASEIILGKWLRSQDAAFVEDAQIATKVGNPNGCPPGETPLSRTQIASHLDQSLRRLGIDRIDLYYIHEFDHVTPLEETLEAMTRAVEAGKIDRFGVSNASLSDVKAVRSLAGSRLAASFEYVQNEYNLLATADCRRADPLLRRAWPSLHGVQPARRRLPHRQIPSRRAAPAQQPLCPCAGGLRALFERIILRRDRAAAPNGARRAGRRWRKPPCASSSTRRGSMA